MASRTRCSASSALHRGAGTRSQVKIDPGSAVHRIRGTRRIE